MAINVTLANTKLYQGAPGWVKVVYDTGAVDANGDPVKVTCHLTKAAIEKQAGVLLPKARIKAILEAELNRITAATGQEIEAL